MGNFNSGGRLTATTDSELKLSIEGYSRVSVDTELDRDNTSIEHQNIIISDYVKERFPLCSLTLTSDRDQSGYTFDQRDNYPVMRRRLMDGESKILVVKDFSRFARRNSLGLYELELLRDAGARIISINDNIDYPTHDDWMQIQLKFLMNEQPVTEASKKVRAVIQKRQSRGEWLCNVPYGYTITSYEKFQFKVVPDEANVIRTIFKLYNDGWGYKRIANHLTDSHIPTPRMKERDRVEAEGRTYKGVAKNEWSIVTISNILTNDFYIGTFRQHKYQRTKINGADKALSKDEHVVFEKFHEPVIDDRTFAYTQEQIKLRSKSNYKGIKKYDTPYSGYLFCGDCGSPMFSMSRPDLPLAYTCGTYHKRGRKGCTSHHTRVDFLDGILKDYIKMVKMNSEFMMEELEKAIADEEDAVESSNKLLMALQSQLDKAMETLKATKRRKIRDLSQSPDDEELIEETYAEIERELSDKIYGLRHQIDFVLEKRNSFIEVNRKSRTVFDVFDGILTKERLSKMDISFIVDRITVYEDGVIDIQLKSDIDNLLQFGAIPNEVKEGGSTSNFNYDSVDISSNQAVYTHRATHQKPKVYAVNVVNEGDPLLTTLTASERMGEMSVALCRLAERARECL